MSHDDVETEKAMAAQAKAVTGLPLVGLTLGTDGAWSARFWEKIGPKSYLRTWCQTVRIVGRGLGVTFNDELCPPCEGAFWLPSKLVLSVRFGKGHLSLNR